MISARGICKSYGSLRVLQGVDLDIHKGEVVSVTGASGAGKSTLIHILGTLDKADSGSVRFQEEDISKLPEKKLAAFRNRNMGFVFQFHHLLPEFTALENICIPAFIGGKDKHASEAKAKELLGILGLTARAEHKPAELSGGEQQRVAVARALINDPSVIFADEPSGNLDSVNARELHDLFFQLREKLGQTFVIVTHNEELAARADRILKMKDGRIL
ncbi:MAG: ABC transporter ATP-binding protein [Bacteroidia bacterium]|nr:ABC transporter ATP-binding protein [Bacteroidia bacterium]